MPETPDNAETRGTDVLDRLRRAVSPAAGRLRKEVERCLSHRSQPGREE